MAMSQPATQQANQTPQITPLAARITSLNTLLARVVPIPAKWLQEAPGGIRGGSSNGGVLTPIECTSWYRLISSWRKALKWTDGLDCALSVMLASITSTRSVGDQLWVKIIAPPSAGKSVLCEAISVAKKYVYAKSSIRGFHSGWKASGGSGEDNSLIAQVNSKTLVTKDGDTLLQSPNLKQILSEARDLYDCTSRTHYRNQMSRDYSGIRMTWILCGTSSLRAIDSSELGERFLDCVIMEKPDNIMEDEIGWRVANRTARNMGVEVNGQPETQYEPELATVMQLTGGYVEYLRDNATELLGGVTSDEEALRYCAKLGKFVAYMRARPSKEQNESSERELSFRLISQHVRLAYCIAVVLGKDKLDAEVMRRVVKVALDTSRGFTLEICRWLHRSGRVGMESRSVALHTNQGEDQTRKMLRFLKRINVVEPVNKLKGKIGTPRWRMTPLVNRLYEEVVSDQ